MHAAAGGSSTLGIPVSVAREFVGDGPPKKSGVRRGRKPSTKPGAQHLGALQKAHAAGDFKAAKTHALNFANALHAHMSSMTAGVASGAGGPTGLNAPPTALQNGAPNQDDMGGSTETTQSNGNFIAGAIKHPGALHRELGVPQGKKIPAAKLNAAAHSSNPLLRKRADLAKTLGKLRK
jgi:hypothetical protein